MSTRNIEAVLQWVARGDGPPEVADALAELAAIREAARTLTRLDVGDYTYKVRERRNGDWEHPDVKAFSDAAVLMSAIAKEGA